MRKLVKYLRHYKKEAVIGPLFKLLEACFELFIPLVMAGIVDRGVRARDQDYILAMGALMVGLGILGLVCSLTAQYFAAKAAAGFGTELRSDLYAHINRLSYSELDTLGTSTLVTRLTNDVNLAQAGVNLVLRLFLRSPFIVAGAVVMAFFINMRLAWIFVALVPLLSLIIYVVMALGVPIYRQVQNGLDKALLSTRENLSGARVIRAFSRQKAEREEFISRNDLLIKTQLLAGRISAVMNPATYAVVNAAVILVLWQGGGKVEEGAITQGDLMALINYMSQILLALVALANLIITFTRASASAVRINEVFAQEPGMSEPQTGRTGQKAANTLPAADAVAFDRVFFSYKGHKDALEDITFSVKRGETVGIIGGTGAGKSSLVNLIPRFYDVHSGSVSVNGKNVKDYTFEELRRRIGVVPQTAVLFAGTVRENMRWGREADDGEILRALEIAQAREFVEEKDGLDTMVAQGGKNFSGGQRQRLTIARALVRKPEILIMDDSASALDYATDARLRRAIAKSTDQMTVFIVSQRAAAIRGADKILVLDDGKIAGLGTHRELMERCGIYREILKSQLGEKEQEAL